VQVSGLGQVGDPVTAQGIADCGAGTVIHAPVQLLSPSEHTLVGVQVMLLGQSDFIMTHGVRDGGGGAVTEGLG
jgi:hypothetical protein